MSEYPGWEDWAAHRPANGHYVYRFHDSEGVLLYVGYTSNLWKRFGAHAEDKDWWPQVAWDRTIVEVISRTQCSGKKCLLPEHAEMQAHEAHLIQHLRPVHNIVFAKCLSGRHLMTEDNIYRTGQNRMCAACRAENRREYEIKNRDRIREYKREWARANPEIVNARNRKSWWKRRGQSHPGAGQSPLF